MMKFVLAGATALLSVTAMTAPATAQSINAAYEYTSTGTLSDISDYTLGFEFSLSDATTVNALGYNTLNLRRDQTVGLWDATGTLLASTVVGTGSGVTGHYAWSTIAPLDLAAGTYRIAGTFTGGDFVYDLKGVTSAAGYTWAKDYQAPGSGLLYPIYTLDGGYGQNGIALVNLSLAGAGGVPEPATWALMILGMGAVGAAMRRRASARVGVRFA